MHGFGYTQVKENSEQGAFVFGEGSIIDVQSGVLRHSSDYDALRSDSEVHLWVKRHMWNYVQHLNARTAARPE